MGIKIQKLITESPSSLNKGNVRVVDQEGDGSAEVVGLGAEIGVEDGNVLAVFDVAAFESFLKGTCLVASPGFSNLVPYVYPLACPPLAFQLHHLLQQFQINFY